MYVHIALKQSVPRITGSSGNGVPAIDSAKSSDRTEPSGTFPWWPAPLSKPMTRSLPLRQDTMSSTFCMLDASFRLGWLWMTTGLTGLDAVVCASHVRAA